MSIYLPNEPIGICDRCRLKFYQKDLYPDINYPGLRVCVDDMDVLDPYRLAPRKTEDITLPFVRIDTNIGLQGPVLAENDNDIITFPTEDGEVELIP